MSKENKAKKFFDHTTISMIAHTGKIVALILSRRLGNETVEFIEEQFVFRKRKGTIYTTGLMKISESVLEVKEDIFSAFYRVDRPNWWRYLKHIGVNGDNVDLFTIYTWRKE